MLFTNQTQCFIIDNNPNYQEIVATAVEPQSKCHQVSTPTEKETLCLRGFDPTS